MARQPGDQWYGAPGIDGYPGTNPLRGHGMMGDDQADNLWGKSWSNKSPEEQRQWLLDNGYNPDDYVIQMDRGGAITGPQGNTLREAPKPPQPSPEQQKLADMKMVAESIQQRRPEVEAARMNALAMQSRAMQPLQNAMATLYGGRGPSSALPNGMGPQGPTPLRPPGPDRLASARPNFSSGGQAGVHVPPPGMFQRMGGLTPQPVPQPPPTGPGAMGGMPVMGPPPPMAGTRMPATALGGPGGGGVAPPQIPRPPTMGVPRPPAPPPPPPHPGTGVSGVTFDPTGMFQSPFNPGSTYR